MNKKREIGAFDLAVALLLDTIDRMMLPMHPKWKRCAICGVNMSLRPGCQVEPNERDIWAEIHPVGWPKESYIGCRFWDAGNMWMAGEGLINARHVPKIEELIPFDFCRATVPYIEPKEPDTPEGEMLIRAIALLHQPNLVSH